MGRTEERKNVTNDVSVVDSLKVAKPDIRHVSCGNAVLLGVPIGDEAVVDIVLNSKLTTFRLLASRLTTLSAHDALFLLKYVEAAVHAALCAVLQEHRPVPI